MRDVPLNGHQEIGPRAVERRGGPAWPLAALLTALVAASWGALFLWNGSPYAGYLAHEGFVDGSLLGALCRSVPQGALIVPAALHALAWVLMIAAMMLPTTFPLLAMFRRVTAARPDGSVLMTLVVAGFFAVWLAFGVVAHGADALVRGLAIRSQWASTHAWAIGAVVLAGAGLFQFSALKYRCLERCRTPFGFVVSRWHGRAPRREAFRLGIDHGAFCVGCCWALMLVMFVVGTGNVGWMIVLAVVMAAEKNLRWGRHLRTPFGVGLIAWALAIVAANA